jgi:lysophospholipase L1-like esterase/fibronectin type 3 domain-containing protein
MIGDDMNRKVCLILVILSLIVLSCGGGGGGGSSPNTAPPAPENILSASGNDQVYLSWGNVSGATTYNIYWSTTAGVRKQSGTKISAVTSPYYQTGLNNGTTYYYVVTAANQYGESAESREISASPSQFTPPLPPKEIAILGLDRKTIIRWTPNEAEIINISYNIYWSTSNGVTKGTGTKIADAASPYTHDGLTNDLTYFYVVTGVNQNGEGLESQEWSAIPAQGNVPSAPTGVTVVAGDRQATISWNDVDKANIYNIYWSTSPDISSKSGTKLAGVKSPHTDSELTQGITYYYVITAANGYGESADSNKVSVTIPDSRKDIGVALGDSITFGYGTTSYAKSYVPLLSARWSKTIYNESMDGGLSSNGAAVIDQLLSQYNPRYITIYYGSNDLGFVDPDRTISNLQYIIQRAKDNGTIPVVATLGPFLNNWAWRRPYAIDLNLRIRQLAASEGIACADIEVALNWNSAYMISDGMHPNDEGHQIIAETFYRALTQ